MPENPNQLPIIAPPGAFRLLRWLSRSAHESVTENLGLRGYQDLVKYLWAERNFDRKYNVKTEYLIPTTKLDFQDPAAQAGANRYRATPPYCIEVSLRHLSKRLAGLKGETMVDYGCGAGRVLILGLEAGFGRVIGLELSPSLVAQCHANLSTYSKARNVGGFEVLEQDATSYVPPPESRIFYFFNPFSPELFYRAVDGIRESVAEHPREIYLMLFQTFRYEVRGLDLVDQITGVQTWTNALNPEAFLARR